MLVYHDMNQERRAAMLGGRTHPWTVFLGDGDGRYWNLIENPGRIRDSLEDFLPFGDNPAIEKFYDLLVWLNGPTSPYESNDSAFSGPTQNGDRQFPFARKCAGRLMIFQRDLKRNVEEDSILNFRADIDRSLATIDPDFEAGCIGYSLFPTHFTALGAGTEIGVTAGVVFALYFWAWGNSDGEVFENLERTFANIEGALRVISSTESAQKSKVENPKPDFL